jgi:hypothetical protein
MASARAKDENKQQQLQLHDQADQRRQSEPTTEPADRATHLDTRMGSELQRRDDALREHADVDRAAQTETRGEAHEDIAPDSRIAELPHPESIPADHPERAREVARTIDESLGTLVKRDQSQQRGLR